MAAPPHAGLKVTVTRTEPRAPHDTPNCGAWSSWKRNESLPLVTTLEGRDPGGSLQMQMQVQVRYHHAEPKLSVATMRQLRRAMAQLVALKRAFGVTKPEVIRVDHWAFTDARRLPAAAGTPVSAENVNGGCTLSGGASVINCFRQEEFEKVWLHEGVHCFRLDFGGVPEADAGIVDPAGIRTDGPVLVNEAWTELLAEAVFVAFRTRSAVASAPWLKAWEREHKHAMKQSACLLRHNGYARANELFDGSRAWRERTNALAYYVLRAALMPKPEEWFPIASMASQNGASQAARYRAFMRTLQSRAIDPAFREGLQRAMDARPTCSSLRMMVGGGDISSPHGKKPSHRRHP